VIRDGASDRGFTVVSDTLSASDNIAVTIRARGGFAARLTRFDPTGAAAATSGGKHPRLP